MVKRLQVLVSPELDVQIEKAAQRSRISKGAWIRRALRKGLRDAKTGKANPSPVDRLLALNAPACDLGEMLRDIEAGRVAKRIRRLRLSE